MSVFPASTTVPGSSSQTLASVEIPDGSISGGVLARWRPSSIREGRPISDKRGILQSKESDEAVAVDKQAPGEVFLSTRSNASLRRLLPGLMRSALGSEELLELISTP